MSLEQINIKPNNEDGMCAILLAHFGNSLSPTVEKINTQVIGKEVIST